MFDLTIDTAIDLAAETGDYARLWRWASDARTRVCSALSREPERLDLERAAHRLDLVRSVAEVLVCDAAA